MDPRDFLRAAREFAAGDDVARCRSALSRSYYALFHVARDHLAAMGFRAPRDQRGHEMVWTYLYNSGVDRVIHVGAQLRRLQTLRVKADYEPRDPHPESAAVVALWVERTAQLIEALDAAAADPPTRARMTRTIATSEQARRSTR